MRRIFVDTSALYAFLDRSDANHARARALARPPAPLVTSNYVFDEIITLVRYEFGHTAAVTVGDRLRASRLCTLLPVTSEDEERAWDIFRRYSDQDFSFTDCTSFALMARLGIKEAYSFDRHFLTMGYPWPA